MYTKSETTGTALSFRPELVFWSKAGSVASLLGEMLEAAARVEPSLPREALLKDLIEREAEFPTALGRGIAAPHACCAELASPLRVVARIEPGVDFDAPDGRPVRLAFLLLSPPADAEKHLADLAQIARLTSNEATREALFAAPTPDALSRLLGGFA